MPNTSEYLNELIKQKEILADNLNNKGISASKDEKYNTLIDKVNNIEVVNGEEITLTNEIEDLESTFAYSFEYPPTTDKNLLDLTPLSTARTANGITIQYLKDEDCIVINGTTKGIGDTTKIAITPIISKDKTFSFSTVYVSGTVTYVEGETSESEIFVGRDTVTPLYTRKLVDSSTQRENITKAATYHELNKIWVYATKGIVFDNYKVKLQLEYGEVSTDYESYGVHKDISLQLSSKNLLPYPYAYSTRTIRGVTFTVNDDASITINGTLDEDVTDVDFRLSSYSVNFAVADPKNTYFVSGSPAGSSYTTYYIEPILYKDNKVAGYGGFAYESGLAVYKPSIDYDRIALKITVKTHETLENVVFKPQLELGSTATTYTSYLTDFSNNVITACGKNLFDKTLNDFTQGKNRAAYANCELVEKTENGWIVQGDKGATGKGNAVWSNGWFRPGADSIPWYNLSKYDGHGIVSAPVSVTVSYDITLLEKTYYPDDTYNFNGRVRRYQYGNSSSVSSGGVEKQYSLKLNETKHISYTYNPPKSSQFIPGYYVPEITLNSNKMKIENVQIEIGTTATDYEPYIGSIYTSDATGKISGVKNIYPLTNILTTDQTAVLNNITGVYKHILPSEDKNCFTKALQPISTEDNDNA